MEYILCIILHVSASDRHAEYPYTRKWKKKKCIVQARQFTCDHSYLFLSLISHPFGLCKLVFCLNMTNTWETPFPSGNWTQLPCFWRAEQQTCVHKSAVPSLQKWFWLGVFNTGSECTKLDPGCHIWQLRPGTMNFETVVCFTTISPNERHQSHCYVRIN